MIDDEQDRNRKIDIPLLVLWGKKGFVNRTYEVLNVERICYKCRWKGT